MSKMDNLRAMREARYAQAADRAKADGTAKRPQGTPAAPVARRLATRPPAPGKPQAETNPVSRRLATRPPAPGRPLAETAPVARKAAARRPAADPAASTAPTAPAAAEEACGHRNMSGRTCTREKGHTAKSHRYS